MRSENMSQEFKDQLKKYQEGTLPEEERLALEADIEKAEIYQDFLSEMLTAEGESPVSDHGKIIKKGRRKSRYANVFYTLAALAVLYLVGNILTMLYFGTGELSRSEQYMEALKVTVAATMPGVSISSGGAQISFPAGVVFEYQQQRQLGGEFISDGFVSGNFSFNRANIRVDHPFLGIRGQLLLPDPVTSWEIHPYQDLSAFDRLEQLPDGTMAEMFISFTELMKMEEVFEHFSQWDIDLRWMGVDTGSDRWGERYEVQFGMPHDGFQLERDLVETESSSERIGLFGRASYRSFMRELAQPFQDVAFREDEFLAALEIMADFPRISNNAALTWADPGEALAYVEEHGIQIAGVLITGPTPELRALQGEPWINHAFLRDVAFLNWPAW